MYGHNILQGVLRLLRLGPQPLSIWDGPAELFPGPLNQ